MRYYVIINGNSSLDVTGLAIKELPPITKPLMRTQKEEIDGRDGDLITELGYSAYDKQLEIGLYGDNYDINDIISFFNTEGTIIFSNEDDKYYNFKIIDQIDYEKLLKFKTAVVTLHCQPFKYLVDEPAIEGSTETVTGEGTNLTLSTGDSWDIESEILGDTEQDGTPTPDSPVDIEVVTGDNEIVVCGKNLFDGELELGSFDSNGAKSYSQVNYRNVNMIPVEPSTTYTFSINGTSQKYCLYYYDEDKTFLEMNLSLTTGTFTTPANTKYINFRSFQSDFTDDYATLKVQLEKGSTATTYEAYQSQSYPLYLGVENLFDKTQELTNTIINSAGGTGTDSSYCASDYLNYTPSTAITLSTDSTSTLIIAEYNSSKTFIKRNIKANATDYTITTDSNTNYIRICYFSSVSEVMLEKGSVVHTYTPYGENIELCKIGDYQDKIYKDNDTWYLHKEIGKVVLDGSSDENYSFNSGTTQFYMTKTNFDTITEPRELSTDALSNYYGFADSWTLNKFSFSSTGALQIWIDDSSITSTALWKTWLSNNNTTIYYVLSTSTDTEITDSTLLSQLEDLDSAYTYEGTTNIITSGDLAPILSVSASGNEPITITNDGNTFAKPILTINGTGTIGVYINDIQVLSIEMGDNTTITIDVTNLEAYNSTALLNRLVTGDYLDLIFESGDTEFYLSGNATSYTITNYNRWI